MDGDGERRTNPRIDVKSTCWCETPGTTMCVMMTNLSRSGVFLKTAVPLAVGHRAVLRWKLPDEHQVVAQGEVVWASQGGTSIPGMGLRFLEIQEGAEDLEAFLYDVLVACAMPDKKPCPYLLMSAHSSFQPWIRILVPAMPNDRCLYFFSGIIESLEVRALQCRYCSDCWSNSAGQNSNRRYSQ